MPHMPGTAQESGHQDTLRPNVYPVLLRHHVPSFAGTAATSAAASPATTSPLQRELALNARLRIRHNRLCLLLTYDPCTQHHPTPKTSPVRHKQSTFSTFAVGSPKQRTSKMSHSSAGSPSTSSKDKQGNRSFRRGSLKTTTGTPVTPTDPQRHPKQYYVVELHDVSPLAAQLPLSAELRANLQLNLVDGEAATYSSHSTPRAVGLSYSCGATSAAATASAVASNFYFPPSRGPVVMSQRTRHESPSANFSAMTAPTYGQYLSAAEPYRVHTRSLQTPRSKAGSGLGSLQHSSSLGEGDLTMIHESHPSSMPRSKSNSPLLRPQQPGPSCEAACLSEQSNAFDDVSATPLLSPTAKRDAISDYAELLLVAFFGVVTAAGVPNLSFSTDAKGEVMVEKKRQKMGSRGWHKSLFKWFVPTKSAGLLPRRSISSLSNISGTISNSTGSPRISPAQPNAPSTLPSKQPKDSKKGKQGNKASTASASSMKHTSSPVSATAAHIDPYKVLELPLSLNKHDTFHLQFLCEDDLCRFLARFVELQTRLREAERAKQTTVSSPLWHPHLRKPTIGSNRFGEEDEESNDGGDNDADRHGKEPQLRESGSTASYNDYPRNGDALGEDSGDDSLLSDLADAAYTSTEPRRRGRRAASGDAAMVALPTDFFRSRGWEEYFRCTMDHRFGVPFATVPLFLWNSFLPLAKLVLYTCYRGFLIVERVPPEASMYSDEDSNTASLSDSERAVEVGKQRLNALVSRLLTPIRAAQTPPRHPPSSSTTRLNRHGVMDVLPVTPLPVNEGKADDGVDSYRSSSSANRDAVKLVLPSTGEAAGQRNHDHLTTVKDVFLCLSESHLLFMSSFGHLRFQCSLDEVALITHSAPTVDFPTYPFFRFRLKSSDFFGAPTFVLTFTLLPEVPNEVRAASLGRFQTAHQAQTHPLQPPTHSRTSSAASSSSSSTTTTSTASDQLHAADDSGTLLADEEKERLLQRHEEFLRIFAAVCPRPLEFRTFAEVLAAELGRSRRIPLSRFTSRPTRKVSGSPVTHFGLGHTPERGSSWMALNYDFNPILCVKVEADDIELYDMEVGGGGEVRRSNNTCSGLTPASSPSVPQRDSSLRRRSKRSTSPELRLKRQGCALTPRWGRDDPGIVLQDAGRDMDFSLEVAMRTMPLLANKEEVHAGYGNSAASTQRSLHPGSHSGEDGGGDTGDNGNKKNTVTAEVPGGAGGGGEFYVPIAPKKKKSFILHRTLVEDA
jgi:hypothetical protein